MHDDRLHNASIAAYLVTLIVAHASMSVPKQSYIFAFYRKCGHIYIYIYIYKYMRISTVPYTAAGPLTIICLMLRHSAIMVRLTLANDGCKTTRLHQVAWETERTVHTGQYNNYSIID